MVEQIGLGLLALGHLVLTLFVLYRLQHTRFIKAYSIKRQALTHKQQLSQSLALLIVLVLLAVFLFRASL